MCYIGIIPFGILFRAELTTEYLEEKHDEKAVGDQLSAVSTNR
jgi:hypothetical protein